MTLDPSMLLERSPAFVGLILLVILAEAFWRLRAGRGYDLGATGATIGVALGQAVTSALGGVVIGAVFLGVWAVAPVRWPLDDWRTWAAAFLLVEFAYYWQHRWSHTIRWMWATHSVHHSPNQMTLPAAARLGWTGLISGTWLPLTPLVALGFHPLLVAGLLTLNLRYQFFLHTEAVGKLGPLEWLFNTPSHHRVHHGRNPEYLDKNFGGVLIIFDRMFGTFAAERRAEPVRYGLTEPLTSNNPFVIAFREWGRMIGDARRAEGLRDCLRALFGRPGLASGSTRSVAETRADMPPQTAGDGMLS